MKFISVTNQDGKTLYLNPSSIIWMEPTPQGTRIETARAQLHVVENIKEILEPASGST